MIGYQVIEQAIKQKVITIFDLADPLCQAGNVDALFDAMQQAGASIGFLLEYAGGQRIQDAPFSGKSWLWNINGYALVRFEGDSAKIESDARQIVDKVITLFDGSHTLGQIAAVARVNEIDEPVPSMINDVPFYWIPFLINVMEKI